MHPPHLVFRRQLRFSESPVRLWSGSHSLSGLFRRRSDFTTSSTARARSLTTVPVADPVASFETRGTDAQTERVAERRYVLSTFADEVRIVLDKRALGSHMFDGHENSVPEASIHVRRIGTHVCR